MSKMTRKAENTTLHRPMDVTLNPGAPLLVETGLWAQLCSYLTPLKRTLWLFFPIFIGQLAATSMGVVDTVMAGAAGTLQLSGVAIGSSIFWPSELFIVGMSLGLHPLIANVVGT